MTQPDPLDELSQSLFEAARQERPSERVRNRARRLASGASATSLAPAAVSRHGARARYVPALGTALALAAAVWIGLAALGRPQREMPMTIAPEALPEQAVPAQKPRDLASAAPRLQPEPQPGPEQAPRARRSPGEAGRSAEKRAPERVASLAEEVAQLDRARAALAAADAARALALVDEYDRVLGGTRLRAEAGLLRIEALAQSGKRAQAAALARRFVREHPGSPLADRARALSQVENGVEGGL